jgi:copper transport protein
VLLGALLGTAGASGLAAALAVTNGPDALWQGRPGQIVSVELAAALAALIAVIRHRHRWAGAVLLVAVAAEGLRSHAEVTVPGWGAALTAVHLAAAAVWVGALLHTARAAWAWRACPPAVRWVALSYARVALWLLVAVLATGTVAAVLLVPLSTLTTTSYGRILLVKLALVTAAVGLALLGRRALSGPDDRLARLRRSTRVEGAVLVAVLAASATLVSAPQARGAPTVPAPAPVGLVVPIGDLAGQIGVNGAASEGQLVVRLSAPRRGDYYGPEEPTDYNLSGTLAEPGGTPVPLAFRACGEGCFVASADWRLGENIVSLRAGAAGWQGATVAARVAWPPQPAGSLLSEVVAAMGVAGQLEVFEAVTSNTANAMPQPTRLQVDSGFFLASEPYGSGQAPQAALISQSPGPRRIAIGFPAERLYATLTLDQRNRIVDETLVDAKHLVRRHFVYPE